MKQLPRRVPFAAVIFAVCACVAGRSGDADPDRPVPPCADREISTAEWRSVTATAVPLTFRLPNELEEKHFEQRTSIGSPADTLQGPTESETQRWYAPGFAYTVHLMRHSEPRAVPLPQAGMSHLMACADTIDGVPARITSYRDQPPAAEGGTPARGSYMIHAYFEAPDLYFTFSASSQSRALQERTLGILRTVRFHLGRRNP